MNKDKKSRKPVTAQQRATRRYRMIFIIISIIVIVTFVLQLTAR